MYSWGGNLLKVCLLRQRWIAGEPIRGIAVESPKVDVIPLSGRSVASLNKVPGTLPACADLRLHAPPFLQTQSQFRTINHQIL